MRAFGILLSIMLVTTSFLISIHPAAATARAVVQNDSMWVDSIGFLHVFGEVKNTGDVWLRLVMITGTLRDAGDAIVDVVFTYTSLMFLAPKSVAPFNLLEADIAKSARVKTYSLVVEFQETGAISQKLLILNTADSKNSLGWLQVVGEVENQGDTPSTYTKVVMTFYDNSGKVVYEDSGYTSPSEIPPGTKYPFRLTVGSDERSSKIARYSLIAESANSGYSSVPELSSPMFVAGIALLLGIIVVGRRRHRSEKKAKWASSAS